MRATKFAPSRSPVFVSSPLYLSLSCLSVCIFACFRVLCDCVFLSTQQSGERVFPSWVIFCGIILHGKLHRNATRHRSSVRAVLAHLHMFSYAAYASGSLCPCPRACWSNADYVTQPTMPAGPVCANCVQLCGLIEPTPPVKGIKD